LQIFGLPDASNFETIQRSLHDNPGSACGRLYLLKQNKDWMRLLLTLKYGIYLCTNVPLMLLQVVVF